MLIDILNGSKVQEEDPVYFFPALGSAQKCRGYLFLLASLSSKEISNPSDVGLVGPTEDAVKALLAYGLRTTDHHRFSEVDDDDDDDSSQVWDVRLARLQILQFRNRAIPSSYLL
ncbi:MAG2-interacting protein [Trifolium repens]|nr:MAG2-interacting protein [Trifolium repens]